MPQLQHVQDVQMTVLEQARHVRRKEYPLSEMKKYEGESPCRPDKLDELKAETWN